MKNIRNVLCVALLWSLAAGSVYAQYKNAEEARDYINDRLSHSLIQKIEDDGMLTISSPGSKYKFSLEKASFNYNGGNNDDRVRVFCDACIRKYEKGVLDETLSRQSFLCDSEKSANEVIAALRFLKKIYSPATQTGGTDNRPLKVTDPGLNAKSVGEAVDYINENLSYSMVMSIDESGIMSINAPDENYRVDLKKAEFGFYDAGDGSKVRIYGDFCITEVDDDGDRELLVRKSFQTPGRVKAYRVISVLYQLKSTFTEVDPARIKWLTDPGPARPDAYKTVREAIDFINSRLSYSIILDVDQKGLVTMNAPDDIYRFYLADSKINFAVNKGGASDWFPFMVTSGNAYGVFVASRNGIKQYDEPDSYETMDEQVFQCSSSSDARDVVKAFGFIRAQLKL